MSNKKTPKPFLKKGTREFLSNATVRTLTQKNAVVEFTDLNDEEPSASSSNAVTFGRQQPEVKISVKRNLSK